MTRNGPNRSVKPKKGTKKGGSIWPANLSLGFFNNNKNNKKKNKRLPVKQKSPIPASKRPPTLNNNSIKVTLGNASKCIPIIFYIICKLLLWKLLRYFFLQPHRVADLDNKLVENLVGNPKRLNPPLSSSSTINLSSNQFTNSFPNQQQNILKNINPTQTSPTNNNGFSVDPAFNPFNSKGSRGNGADFFPPQNGFNIR